MAKLKATPKNFEQALLALGLKDSVRLGNNTYLEVTAKDRDLVTEIGVRLHGTYIIRFHGAFDSDGYRSYFTTLHTGGYYTVTTKERINHFISGRVYQKAHQWYYVRNRGELGIDWGKPVEFTEGIEV